MWFNLRVCAMHGELYAFVNEHLQQVDVTNPIIDALIESAQTNSKQKKEVASRCGSQFCFDSIIYKHRPTIVCVAIAFFLLCPVECCMQSITIHAGGTSALGECDLSMFRNKEKKPAFQLTCQCDIKHRHILLIGYGIWNVFVLGISFIAIRFPFRPHKSKEIITIQWPNIEYAFHLIFVSWSLWWRSYFQLLLIIYI